uniref:ATP synthase complex subunit 8 n=1 Tax=Parapercis cylindrica TaxID=215381 RepID=A0A1V1FZ98_9TELE|nr:ATPase subunit 8 [Parapercis cylindrica]
MPQLDPKPWLIILTFTWIVFLTMIPTKVLAHTFPNAPQAKATEKVETQTWNWPWY